MSKAYPANSTLRFIFPEGFTSAKVICNITGVSVPSMKTYVFPNGHIYDCRNINSGLSASQTILISGIVNPDREMAVSSMQVHILQPNNKVVVEKLSMQNSVTISRKNMNATVIIPNLFRNNTLTYVFEINIDSNLGAGDYMQIDFEGSWTFFLNNSRIIEGVNSNSQFTPTFSAIPNAVLLTNFSSILRSSQIAF